MQEVAQMVWSLFFSEGKRNQAGEHPRKKNATLRRQLTIARVFGLEIPEVETMTFCSIHSGVELYLTVAKYNSNYMDYLREG